MTTHIEPNSPRWYPSVDPASIIVPGLDENAPINDQVDQIEQLITIKLQNIDANFSRIQNLMATRLLPAVKRYALGTESVREAAKFWTSFYEQAAQVHIPTLDDDDVVLQDEQTQHSFPPSESESTPVSRPTLGVDVTPPRTLPEITAGTNIYDVTASDSSFMPANAVSSTPARLGHASNRTVDDSIMYEEENTIQQPPLIAPDKTKAEKSVPRFDHDEPKAGAQSSHDPRSTLPTPRANVTNTYVSPLKVKPKTPMAIPRHIQSFLPEKLENEPIFPSPRRPRYERTPRKPTGSPTSTSTSTSASSSVLDIPSLTQHESDSNQAPKFTAFNDSFDDSIDLMQGMSPPRTLAFARAPRSSVGLGLLPPLGRTPGKDLLPILGRTPGKEAADRIRRDLLGDMQSQLGSLNSAASNKMRTPAFGYGTSATKDDTMSTIPTPPSLSRYMRHAQPSWADNNDTYTSLAASLELHPDDSFGSSNSNDSNDSLDVERNDVAVHPFARALEASGEDADGFDDSFDSEGGYEGGGGEDTSEATEEETVFGIPPAKRKQQGRALGPLKMLGEDLLQDTIGIGGQLAKVGRSEESPTPYGRS